MFTNPEKNIVEFGFLPGQTIADFGSGSGYYSLAISQAVGSAGRVYAIDLNEEALVRLKKIAEKENKGNIEVLLGDVDNLNGSGLKDEIADGVVLSNILFQLENVKMAITEAKRITKTDGKICLIEWINKFPEIKTKEICEEVGLKFERRFEAGDSHYGLIFRK